MPEDGAAAHEMPARQVDVLDWADVCEPGCYLHIATGLLARIRLRELASRAHTPEGVVGSVARLSANPETPLVALRAIAMQSHFRVNF